MEDVGHSAENTSQHEDRASAFVIDALGSLLRASPDALDAAIEAVLARMAQVTGADRVYLFLKTGDLWSNTHEWCAPGVRSVKTTMQDIPAGLFGHPSDTTGTASALNVADVYHMPAGPLRSLLQDQDIKSILEVPLIRDSAVYGLVGLDRVQQARGFCDRDQWLLNTLSDGLTSSLARRQAERNLATVSAQQGQTLERLRATLAAMPELVLEIDEDGRCIDFHCSEPQLLARPPEEILGQTLEDTLPPDIAAQQRKGMDQARRDGTANVGPYALGTGMSERWYALTIARRSGAGGPDGFVFRARDVTLEHALDSENALLVQVTRRMTNLAMVLDPDLAIRWVNPALEARTGFSLDEMRGKDVAAFVDPGADPAELEKIGYALTNRIAGHAEIYKTDQRGERYCVDVDVQPLVRPDGTFDGFLVIETEITERKQHETELETLAAEASASRQRLQEAIAAIPDGFAYFDSDDRLILCNQQYRNMLPEIAERIKPGIRFEDILDAAIAQGELAESIGDGVAWKARRLAKHIDASGEMELRLNNGRWIRAYERLTPEGGRVGLRIDVTDLKNTEQRLSDIIDGARIGTWEYNADTHSTVLNGHWGSMLADENNMFSELTDENWRRYFHPDDIDNVRAAMLSVQQGEQNDFEQEFRLRHHHGHWVHVLGRGRVISHDANGRPSRISGVGLDLTERRHAEERLRAILDASSIGTWQLNSETGAVIIDEQYAAMLGYSRAELQPFTRQRFESLVHPVDLSEIWASLAKLGRESRSAIEHEFRVRHRDGHWVWVLSQARVLRWSDSGLPAEESGVHIDISERKKREAALAQAKRAMEQALAAQKDSEQRFSDIAEVSDEWFWEIGPGQRIVHLTSGFERITGLQVETMRGRRLPELGFAPGSETVQGDWERLATCVANREPLSDFLFRIIVDEARAPIWLRISGAPFVDATGEFAGFRGVGSSVSELIAATERAEAASHAKSRFLANMSHELRTPLTGVLGMAELLGDTEVTQQQRDMIGTIRDSGEGLLTILNDVLDLAKIEAGKMSIDRDAFVPAQLLDQVRALFEPKTLTSGLALSIHSDAPCRDRWLGDANRLQQVLNNLIGNAVKFTQHGSVTISARIERAADGDILVLSVEDTGIGMSPDQVNKVFDEFEQAEGSTARRFGGTGLGLSITKRLVTLMGGEISLRSETGKGTQATVRLPVSAAPDQPPTPQVPIATRTVDLSGLRVLVADDNQTNRKILETMLGALGLQVTLACDGHEACRTYELARFNLLLLDISMPGLDGIGALQAIRLYEDASGTAHVPALAVTANAMQHQVEEYLAAGFAGHIAKPFRKSTLAETISRHLMATL